MPELNRKNGSILQRAVYAILQAARDVLVVGTGVSASAFIALVLGEHVDTEVGAIVAVASLAAWRILRQNILNLLNRALVGDGGVS